MSDHYDALETRDPEERERALLAALPRQVAHARANAPGFARILRDLDPRRITTRAALAGLPVTRKSDLKVLQAELRPLGGLNATPLACGCTIVPAGVGQTEQQVAAIAELRASAYIGTPSFLKVIVEKADELQADVGCLKKAMVGAEYLPPALRANLGERGIGVMQCYATADLGLLAYESRGPDGAVCDGMVVDEGILLEIVRPGTGTPVPPGEVGEIVVTTFNRDYSLIRFATGDLTAVLP